MVVADRSREQDPGAATCQATRTLGRERALAMVGLKWIQTDGHRGRSEIASYSSLRQSMRAACSRPASSSGANPIGMMAFEGNARLVQFPCSRSSFLGTASCMKRLLGCLSGKRLARGEEFCGLRSDARTIDL